MTASAPAAIVETPKAPLHFGAIADTHVEWIVEAHRRDGEFSEEFRFAYLRLNRDILTEVARQAADLKTLFEASAAQERGTTPLNIQMRIAMHKDKDMCFWGCDDQDRRAVWVIEYSDQGAVLRCEHAVGDCVTTNMNLARLIDESKWLDTAQFGAYCSDNCHAAFVEDLGTALEVEHYPSSRQELLSRAYAAARARALEADGDEDDRDAS